MIIKNSNLRQNLFKSRYKILAIIFAIILILCVIRLLNNLAKEQNRNNDNTQTKVQTSYKPQETVIMGGDVAKTKQEEVEKIMDEFINLCNTKQIEKAYNLLTEECKKEVFASSIQNFQKDFVEKIFATSKTYNMQSWINGENPTYKVRILEDVMSTGKTGETIEDYYTIVKKDNIYKLNINSYVGRKEINKKTYKDDITIEVLSKDTNMEYETYKIKVQNNTKNTIILDTKTNGKSVYLTGSNGTTYRAFMYEIDDIFLTIKPRINKRNRNKI